MTFLLDTNILSEAAKPRPDASFLDWFTSTPDELMYVSVITLGEICKGAAKIKGAQPERAEELARLLSALESAYGNRILPINSEVAHAWGPLTLLSPNHPLDNYLAATALVHGLTVVTRNTRDFAALDVPLLNPFAASGSVAGGA